MKKLRAFSVFSVLSVVNVLLAGLASAEVGRQHGVVLLGMRMQGLKSAVPAARVRDWDGNKLVEWENPGQPDIHICAQVYKDRVYRIVVNYDPKYGRTQFNDFIAFMRIATGKRPRWTLQGRDHRTVGVWQDTKTRLELWSPGQNTASYTTVFFDLKSQKGQQEALVKPQNISWRGCGGDQK